MQVIGAPGEFPSLNELTAPPGGAVSAVNVVVDVDSYATHPGLSISAEGEGNLSAMTLYKGAIIAHSESNSTLQRLVAGAWTSYAGTYNAPSCELMSFVEAQGSLFFTTSNGLYRLDALASEPVLSGVPQALPGTAALSGASGFLGDGEATAYRWNFAVNVDDGNTGRLVQGAPSPLLVVSNSAGGSRDVDLSIPIPDSLPANAFLQVYRADSVPNTISPTNEVRQVYERTPTAAEITAGTLSVTDTTPDTVKGAGAYYASNTGAGIAQSNYRAPALSGVVKFSDSVFDVAATGVHRLGFTILGTGGSGLVTGQSLVFQRGSTTEYYQAGASESFPNGFKLFTGGTPAQNLTSTVDSLVRAINSRPGGLLIAFASDSDGTRPGGVLVESRTLDQTPVIFWTLSGNGQAFAPAPQTHAIIATVSRVSNVTTATGPFAHGFAIGDTVRLITGFGTFPVGTFVVASIPTPESFTYADVGADSVGGGTLEYILDVEQVETSSGTASNAVAWTPRYEPDHWPLANLNTVGGADDVLWWGLPLDRFLFLGSEAGLFRVQGNADDGFDFGEGVWDSSTRFLGRRNVASLDGRAYALASEGLVSWSEGSKPRPVDTPIQDEIRARLREFPDVIAQYGFLLADGVNHRLYVAMPTASSDTSAKVLHVLNVSGGGAWTRLDTTFPGFEDGTTYGLAPTEASGTAYFLQPGSPFLLTTRNTATQADYQGPAGEAIPASVTFLPLVAGEPERQKQWTWTRIFTKAPTTALQFCYSTDWVPTLECQSLPAMDPITAPVDVVEPVRSQAWKTIVGQSRQRGRALSVQISHATAQERFRLLGFEVKHRAYGSGQ